VKKKQPFTAALKNARALSFVHTILISSPLQPVRVEQRGLWFNVFPPRSVSRPARPPPPPTATRIIRLINVNPFKQRPDVFIPQSLNRATLLYTYSQTYCTCTFLPAPFSDDNLMMPHYLCAPPLHFWPISDFPRGY